MARRASRNMGKQARPVVVPSPQLSAIPTPNGSTYTSTYTSEADTEDEVNKLPIGSLSLKAAGPTSRRPSRIPSKPFPLLQLPSELRLKIYSYYFEDTDNEVLDLGPDLYKRLHKRLGLVRVCRLIHDEATHYFYSTRTFRVFPTFPGKYFKSRKPLLARLKPIQRECITSLEVRFGPGWSAPPKGWTVTDALGLKQCKNVQRLNVFVEFDPSDANFKEFRRSDGFYEGFSHNLLTNVLNELPAVKFIRYDGWPGVKKTGGMMRTLLQVAERSQRMVLWGPERGWTDAEEEVIIDRGNNFTPIEGLSLEQFASQNLLLVA